MCGRRTDVGRKGHEFAVVEGDKAIHFLNREEYATRNESAKIGFKGKCYVRYDGFREVDVKSWETTFEWEERDHISLDETYGSPDDKPAALCSSKRGFDYTHLNALHKFPDGDFLVSSRRTFTLYKVSRKTGAIVWRLGGKKSSFKQDTTWVGQHGARVQSQNETHIVVSMMDNAKFSNSLPKSHKNSRALFLVLHLTEQPMRAETLLSIDQPLGSYNMARGNVQVLPNDNIHVCWVKKCLLSEHTRVRFIEADLEVSSGC